MGQKSTFQEGWVAIAVLGALLALGGCGSSTGYSPKTQSGGGTFVPGPVPGLSPKPTPQSGPPSPKAPGANPSFQVLLQNTFLPKCVNCHSVNLASANVMLDSYQNVMSGLAVIASDPMHSKLYIATSEAFMPLNAPALSSAEIDNIYTWIQQGAQNN